MLVVAGLGRLSSDQQIEVGPVETTIVDEATLRVLSTSSPGFSLDFATALPADTEPADCVGCVDLWIVPRDWIPVGVSDLMTVAVESPGFTNTPDAEQLTIRGADATLGTIGEITKLAWTESAGTSVVVTFGGYSRDEAIVVAEGLVWWSNDGLVFRLDRTNNDLDVEQLADFAVTLDEVSDTQWAELGGR